MKKIHETLYTKMNKYSQKLIIYVLESEREYLNFASMKFPQLCEFFGVHDDYNVPMGAEFHRYDFELTTHYMIVIDTVSRNI